MKSVKKLVLGLAFIASTFAANAQTKEATIEWLESKLPEYVFAQRWYPNDMKITVTECEIVISGTQKDESFVSECHYATNFTKIENGYISYDYNGYRVIEKGTQRVIAEKKNGIFCLTAKPHPRWQNA
ncbi:hypothetical protein [Viscerimonas tarda]